MYSWQVYLISTDQAIYAMFGQKKHPSIPANFCNFLCFFVGNGWRFMEPFFTMQGLTCLEHTPDKKVRGTASQETQEASETALLGHVSRCVSSDFPRWVRKPTYLDFFCDGFGS